MIHTINDGLILRFKIAPGDWLVKQTAMSDVIEMCSYRANWFIVTLSTGEQRNVSWCKGQMKLD